MTATLHHRVQDDRAGGFGESGQLGHGGFRFLGPDAAGPDADQDDLLELQLAVFDLGDVPEFGGEPRDAAERGAVSQVVITLGSESIGLIGGVHSVIQTVTEVATGTCAKVGALGFYS